MNVLWITYILFPEAEAFLSGQCDFKSSGGWLIGSAESLANSEGVKLFISSITNKVNQFTHIKGEKIDYYLIPPKVKNTAKGYKDKDVLNSFYELTKIIRPDIVHIQGTELSYGLSYLEHISTDNVVISLQGIISEISKYYSAGLSKYEIFKNLTLRDCLFSSSVFQEERNFIMRGELEKKIIRTAKHVIGRTSFDKSHAWAINPSCHYHFCNETLRSEFYDGRWKYEECTKHTIFLSQANYPVKGLHIFLKALPLVQKKYPNLKVYIGGYDITRKTENLMRRIMAPGYSRILSSIIRKYKLDSIVSFVGVLSASEMKKQLLSANIFACPSTIENSPNSLAEAQILGVPVVASYVGGIPDMITNESCGYLYRFDDVEVLAYLICQIFETQHFENKQVIEIARARHNRVTNNNDLLSIYHKITQ